VPDPASPRLLAATRRATWILLAAGVVAFLAVGQGTAARPSLVSPGVTVPAGDGTPFGQVSFQVQASPGLTAPGGASCALLASSPAERGRGLMGRRSLGRFAGMVFQYARPSTDVFYMYGTPLPLTVAWFDQDGTFISAADMAPCPSATCPYYGAPRPFSFALEVPGGGLRGIGVGTGSVVTLGGSCIG